MQAGVDVSKHGGHAYPGMEDVYDAELKGLDVTNDDVPHQKHVGSSGIDYSLGGSKLQRQVIGVCRLHSPKNAGDNPSVTMMVLAYYCAPVSLQ